MITVVNMIIFFPALLIVAGLSVYAGLWLLAFCLGFGGNPTRGLKLGKTVNDKIFNNNKKEAK